MTETLLKVENIAKKYCKTIKRSMIYGLSDIGRNLMGLSSHPDRLRKNEFWALDDISFKLKRGETLGVIGANGSGKTTLLKLLSGIFWPDKGRIAITGRVGALIEVGAGFHPLLTGRENIYLNGSILGMSRTEINQKLEEIINFADIGDFLDTPVNKYSSGMFVKLGFAIAVHADPDILLIDEVLAVGDIAFRRKCFNKIDELKNRAAIIIISHDMFQISRVCDSLMYLDKGSMVYKGKLDDGISLYYDRSFKKKYIKKKKNIDGPIRVMNADYKLGENLIEIEIHIEKEKSHNAIPYIISINFHNFTDTLCANANSLNENRIFNKETLIKCTIPHLNLNHGKYSLSILISDEKRTKYYSIRRNILEFSIQRNFVGNASILFNDTKWDVLE